MTTEVDSVGVTSGLEKARFTQGGNRTRRVTVSVQRATCAVFLALKLLALVLQMIISNGVYIDFQSYNNFISLLETITSVYLSYNLSLSYIQLFFAYIFDLCLFHILFMLKLVRTYLFSHALVVALIQERFLAECLSMYTVKIYKFYFNINLQSSLFHGQVLARFRQCECLSVCSIHIKCFRLNMAQRDTTCLSYYALVLLVQLYSRTQNYVSLIITDLTFYILGYNGS